MQVAGGSTLLCWFLNDLDAGSYSTRLAGCRLIDAGCKLLVKSSRCLEVLHPGLAGFAKTEIYHIFGSTRVHGVFYCSPDSNFPVCSNLLLYPYFCFLAHPLDLALWTVCLSTNSRSVKENTLDQDGEHIRNTKDQDRERFLPLMFCH